LGSCTGSLLLLSRTARSISAAGSSARKCIDCCLAGGASILSTRVSIEARANTQAATTSTANSTRPSAASMHVVNAALRQDSRLRTARLSIRRHFLRAEDLLCARQRSPRRPLVAWNAVASIRSASIGGYRLGRGSGRLKRMRKNDVVVAQRSLPARQLGAWSGHPNRACDHRRGSRRLTSFLSDDWPMKGCPSAICAPHHFFKRGAIR
jgi:hypothetical protein